MLPNQDCAIPQDVCCTSLFDIANHILSGVYVALLECFQPTPCNQGGLIAYVTMGNGDDLVFDALTVAIGSVNPSNNTTRNGTQSPLGMYQALFTVRLMESGWPMAYEENGEIFPPDAGLQNALARHAYAHGERMYRQLAYMVSHSDVTPPGSGCTSATLGNLTPMNPMMGTVGWQANVLLTLPWGR